MNFEALVKHISTIQNTLQAQAAHAVNLALTSRNWLMGCYIVEFEQNGEDRAAYGEQLLKKLEQRLKTKAWMNEDSERLDGCTLFIHSWKNLLHSILHRKFKFGSHWPPNSPNQFGGWRPPNLKIASGNYQQNIHKPKHGWFRLIDYSTDYLPPI